MTVGFWRTSLHGIVYLKTPRMRHRFIFELLEVHFVLAKEYVSCRHFVITTSKFSHKPIVVVKVGLFYEMFFSHVRLRLERIKFFTPKIMGSV